jgi:putative colanic acid biosynthesis UDP-glucose lipid carrier transferase
MSVVGPRPHIKDLNDKYDSTISNYNDRILVKPGITGLSQITGHRGETNGNASMANRIRIDILYLRSWTMYLDLVIIYKTIIDVLFFKSKNAY